MLKQGVQEITTFFGFCIISWNHLDFWLTGILVKASQSPRTRDGSSFQFVLWSKVCTKDFSFSFSKEILIFI